MAIKSTFFSNTFHQFFDKAYQKIDNVRIAKGTVSFDLLVYASQEAKIADAAPLATLGFAIEFAALDLYEGDNIIAKLYDVTKKEHPLFKDFPEKVIENV